MAECLVRYHRMASARPGHSAAQQPKRAHELLGAAAHLPRTPFQEIFGFGLGNGTFNGLPIDSNWMSSYNEQGLWGVTLCALILIFLYLDASFAPRGAQRALALFFTTYCLIASYTEDGFTSPTTYTLDVMLAASLLIPFGMIQDQDAD